MLLFAHLGITLGTAAIAAELNNKFNVPKATEVMAEYTHKTNLAAKLKSIPSITSSWFDTLAQYTDIRVILIGSILPDIIDKPIGHWLLAGELDNGRIFAHSLIFLILVMIPGIITYYRHLNKFMPALAFGILMHLILDTMWLNPHTFFWPFQGIAFEHGEPGNYLANWLQSLSNANIYIPEIVGLFIIMAFCVWTLKRKSLQHFIFKGRIK